MENIFIPSKGRSETSQLLKFFKETKVNATIVVEKQDFEKYHKNFNCFNYIVLPESNKGITYVRNYIKEFTEKNLIPFYWQLDDDITGFFKREGTKLIRGGVELLLLAKEQFNENNISLGSLEYRQFAWSATKDSVENSFCDSCVFVDNILTKGLRYNHYLEGKEDRDFAMQVIKNGGKTSRTTLFAFSAPANGSNSGGLKEIFYDVSGREETCSNRMVEFWGENICIPITKKDGRKDVKIMWGLINSTQQSLF